MTTTNHGIDYNGGGVLSGRRHSPLAKIDSITHRPPPHPARGLAGVIFCGSLYVLCFLKEDVRVN